MEFILLLLILFAFGIRTSWFQTWAAQQVADYLSGELGTEITIDKVDIIFFDSVELLGIYVEDSRHDTLLYTESIVAEIDNFSISDKYLDVHKVDLNHGRFYMRKYEGDSTLNFQHIIDYFKPEERDTTKGKFAVNVQNVWLEDIKFIYRDFNIEPKANGLDFANLELNHVTGRFSEFGFLGDSLQVAIDQLQFKDRSGMTLSKFSAAASYSPRAVSLEDLKIAVNNSYVFAQIFELHTPNGPSDWKDFVHKVRFNAKIRNSKISLKDVSYFVPRIWGMTDRVKLHEVNVTGPVYGMKIKDLHLTMLEETVLKGRLEIPKNLDKMEEAYFLERIKLFETTIADVERMNLSPFLKDGKKHIRVPDNYRAANKVRVVEAHMDGFISSFVVDGDVYSGLGDVHSANGIKFFKGTQEQCANNGVKYEGLDTVYYYVGMYGEVQQDIIVENLALNAIAKNDLLGSATGFVKILPGSKGLDLKTMNLDFVGHFSHVELSDYPYHDINIRKGNYSRNRFTGVIDIIDDNLALNYDGYVDMNRDLAFEFDVRIDSAHLAELTHQHDTVFHRFEGKVHVSMKGNSINRLRGTVTGENLTYQDATKDLYIKNLLVDLRRTPTRDSLITHDTVYVRSDLVDLDLFGVFDFNDMHQVVLNELAYVADNMVGKPSEHKSNNETVDLEIRLKNINPIMPFLGTDLYVAEKSVIKSQYDAKKKLFGFDLMTDSLRLGNIKLTELKMENHFDSTRATIFYQSEGAQLNDSTKVRNLYLESDLKNNRAINSVGWDPLGSMKPALFAFISTLDSTQAIHNKFQPSFFFLQDHRYKIDPKSEISWSLDKIVAKGFKISEGEHYLSLDGTVSKDPNDWLNFIVHDFDLAHLNGFLERNGVALQGSLNIEGQVADLYKNIRFESESNVKDLYINARLVGDINVDNTWQQGSQSVTLDGSLVRNGLTTFGFDGDYYVNKEKDNIRATLEFEDTDISFLNAFEDPELYTDIEGTLHGTLDVTGEINNPIIEGDLGVQSLLVFVPMFNVGYGIDGTLSFGEGEIYADFMDVYDQEGNKATAGLSIYHTNYNNWNYDITLDMTETKNRFFVLDTKYKEGEFYYGRAYIDGWVNISGHGGKTTIEVDAKTMKGTELTLPMYGASELEEGNFIVWKKDENDQSQEEEEIVQNSGLELKMNFKITPDAKTTVVFDPVTEDQITAYGEGDLDITVDEYYEVTMYGKYKITEGNYAMRIKTGPIKAVTKTFNLEPGSNLIWTGSPYDALINIAATFEKNVDFTDILPRGTPPRGSDLVKGYLNMTNKLMSPQLSFDLRADNADDLAKQALSQLRGNKDAMNKQFFSVLMLGGFFPTEGVAAAAGKEAFRDAAEGQLNQILSGVGDNYDLNVDLKEGQTNFGATTQLGEKITVTTSFGVVNPDSEGNTPGGNSLVGDVSVDYKLNDDGTFTLNFFNESNTGTDAEQGAYTQGVGLHYSESFNTVREFRLLQRFLNIFRRKSKDVDLSKKKNKKTVNIDEYLKDRDEKDSNSE